MAKKKRADREAEKRQREYAEGQRKLGRRRTWVGLLGFIPLAVSLGCGSAIDLGPFCTIPSNWWLLIWAGLFGSFLGLTIRLVLERRRFEKGQRGAA